MTYLRLLSLSLILISAPSLASARALNLCQQGFSYYSGVQSLCQKTIRKELNNGLRDKVDLIWACHSRNPDNPPDTSGCAVGSSKLPGDLIIRETEIFFNGNANKIGSNGAHLPDGPYHCCFTQTPPPNELFRSVAIEPIVID